MHKIAVRDLRWLYIDRGYGIPSIARMTGVPMSTIRNMLKARGILRTGTQAAFAFHARRKVEEGTSIREVLAAKIEDNVQPTIF